MTPRVYNFIEYCKFGVRKTLNKSNGSKSSTTSTVVSGMSSASVAPDNSEATDKETTSDSKK
jgi:hypothetical protein